jgi:hypothetical protein
VVFRLNTTLYGLMVAAVSSSQPGLGTSLVDILTTSTSLTSGCQMSWNYFGSGHGKGEVDGASALLKRQIRIEQIKPQGRKLQNATKIVEFLKEQSARVHVGPRGARCTTSKFFWEIKTAGIGAMDREDTRQAERVPGSMSMHQCRSVSPRDCTLVQFRQLTCFCYACLGYDTSYSCHQADHVQEWKLYRLSPRLPTQARTLYDSNNEIEAGTGGEWIADALCIGDNITVRA